MFPLQAFYDVRTDFRYHAYNINGIVKTQKKIFFIRSTFMTIKNTLKLILLSAIWGGSFIFMRIISPVLGPVLTASMRTLIAGLFLIVIFKFTRYKIYWKRDYKQFIIIGIINSSIPFYMYAYAALHIPASLSAIMNSMSPMFGAIFSAIFLIEPLTIKKSTGLILGTIGVAIVTSLNVAGVGISYYLSLGACIVAAICYGIGSIYIKLKASHIEPKAIAAGSQFFAGLALLPFIIFDPISINLDFKLVVTVILFAVICSALAYLIYYDLILNIGPTKALTVTFLIPIFGIIWGYLLLHEPIKLSTIIGGLVILLGTFLVTSSKATKPNHG